MNLSRIVDAYNAIPLLRYVKLGGIFTDRSNAREVRHYSEFTRKAR